MINGIILVDKPKGVSSNTVVNIVKKCVGANKAGHLGTLDVAGHGLLPVTLGKSTKLFDYFLNKDKVYRATFKFGVESDTLDLEGEIIITDDKKNSSEEICETLPKLIGKQYQMPPIYSAKKINGMKAYDLARAGKDVQLKPKLIEIYDLKLIKKVGDNEFLFEIHCSSGTYIRSLCRDMARLLSTCGLMSDIIRTRCGSFSLDESYTLEEIKCGKYDIISPDTIFNYEKIFLTFQEVTKILNGVNLKRSEPDGDYSIYDNNDFIGIGRIEKGFLRITLRLI